MKDQRRPKLISVLFRLWRTTRPPYSPKSSWQRTRTPASSSRSATRTSGTTAWRRRWSTRTSRRRTRTRVPWRPCRAGITGTAYVYFFLPLPLPAPCPPFFFLREAVRRLTNFHAHGSCSGTMTLPSTAGRRTADRMSWCGRRGGERGTGSSNIRPAAAGLRFASFWACRSPMRRTRGATTGPCTRRRCRRGSGRKRERARLRCVVRLEGMFSKVRLGFSFSSSFSLGYTVIFRHSWESI